MKEIQIKQLWALAWCACLIISAAAVMDRANGYPEFVPHALRKALAFFLEPGLTVWWMTVGGLFEGFPSNGLGYAVAIISNAIIWLGVFMLARKVWGRIKR